MSDGNSPDQSTPGIQGAAPEVKRLSPSEEFTILRNTYEHYTANSLNAVVGWIERLVNRPTFPNDQDSQQTAQALTEWLLEAQVTHGVLSAITYDSNIRKHGNQFMFDIGGEIAERLNPNQNPEQNTQEPSQIPQQDLDNIDRFRTFQHTITHYIDHLLMDPRVYLEQLESRLQDPDLLNLARKAQQGVLKTIAVKEVIGDLSKDTQTATDSGGHVQYNLDKKIAERTIKLAQESHPSNT